MKATFRVTRLALILSLSLLISSTGVAGQDIKGRTSDRTKGRTSDRISKSGNSPAASNTMHDAPGDFNGDGRTDFSIVRQGIGGGSGTLTWWIRLNGPNTHSARPFGFNSDFIVPADYDGDGADDRSTRAADTAACGSRGTRTGDNPIRS